MEIRNDSDEPVDYVILSPTDVFRNQVVSVLEEHICPLLPANCAGAYITLLVRVPYQPDADLIVTPDQYDEMRALLDRREERERELKQSAELDDLIGGVGV